MKKRIIEVAVKVIVAALTAFLTAITTTSCMGYGPLPKIVQISLMKNPLAVAGGFSLKILQYYNITLQIKINRDLFCISLDLYYLCTQKRYKTI